MYVPNRDRATCAMNMRVLLNTRAFMKCDATVYT